MDEIYDALLAIAEAIRDAVARCGLEIDQVAPERLATLYNMTIPPGRSPDIPYEVLERCAFTIGCHVGRMSRK